MSSLLVATTRLQDLQPLAAAGQTPTEAWAVLSALLTRELSPAHAALLAEPVENPSRAETDWYVEGDGPVLPLDQLDPAARTAAEARLDTLVADIERLAATKRAASAAAEQFLGELLSAATRIPDRAWLRVMTTPSGPQPVLVAWGHRRAGIGTAPVELTGRAQRPLAPMSLLPPPRVPVPISLLRRWLVPALIGGLLPLLIALVLLAVDPFGWFVAEAVSCAVPNTQLDLLAQLRAETDREALLRGQIASTESDAGHRRQLCPPVHVTAPTQGAGGGASQGQNQAQDQQRALQRGAANGKLQIILAWDDRNDLDLHVRCDNEELYYNRRNACGGTLDVDANSNAATATTTPVENASWANPPPGHYDVIVGAYDMAAAASSPFRVTILQDGQPPRVVTGTMTRGQSAQKVAGVDIAAP
jgi:hypothetical protein